MVFVGLIAVSYSYIGSRINLIFISTEVAQIFMSLPLIYTRVNKFLSPRILSMTPGKTLFALVCFEIGITYFYIAIFFIFAYGAHQPSFLIYVNVFSLVWTTQLTAMCNAFTPIWGGKANKNFLEQGYWQFYIQEIQATGDCIIVPSSSYMASQIMLIICYIFKYLGIAEIGYHIFKTLS